MNVTKVIRNLLKRECPVSDTPLCGDRWVKNCCPYVINNGCCEYFAIAILNIINNGQETDDIYIDATPADVEDCIDKYENWPIHYWFVCNGLCYDSECPEGVADWKDLPIYKKYRKYLETNDKAHLLEH